MVAHIVKHLQGIPNVKAWRHFPYRPSREVPVVVVELLEGNALAAEKVLERLQEKDPPIYAYAPKKGFGYAAGRGLVLNPHTMLEGEERIVAERLREVLLAGT